MTGPADETIVRQAQAGDHEAFRHLLRVHQDAVHGYCLRILGNAFEAEEASQESFVRCYERLPSLDHPSAFRWWLYTIVRHEVFGRLRRRKQYRPVALEDADQDVWETDSPLERVIAEERSAQLRRLLDRLRPEYREALMLREIEGMTYDEIAAVTGATVSAIKSRLFKARRALALAASDEGNDT